MAFVCFLVLLVFTYFCYKHAREKQTASVRDLFVADKWQNYRLGDAYKFTDKKFGCMEGMKAGEYQKKQFPGSIAARYAVSANMKRRLPGALVHATDEMCSTIRDKRKKKRL